MSAIVVRAATLRSSLGESDPEAVEDPRTLQANERTLLAWLRTGISLITFGFFIAKSPLWFGGREAPHQARGTETIGLLFVALGTICEGIGVIRYIRIRRALLERRATPVGATEIVAIGLLLTLLGGLLTYYATL
jgi:putative membrane protein